MTMKNVVIVALLMIAGRCYAQEIGGKVLDSRDKNPIIMAQLQVLQGGKVMGTTITDFDGHYVIKPLDPGTYDLKTWYSGCDTSIVTGVIVNPGQHTTVSFVLHPNKVATVAGKIAPPKRKLPDEARPTLMVYDSLTSLPVIGPQPKTVNTPTLQTCGCRRELVEQPSTGWFMPVTSLFDYVATVPGAYQRRRGDPVSIYGSRPGGVLYIIDGIYQ
jgi:Carboxypeptidase regulatory-like domain